MSVTIDQPPSSSPVDARQSLPVSGTDTANPPAVVGVLTDVSTGQPWNNDPPSEYESSKGGYATYKLNFTTNGTPPGVGSRDYLSVSVHDTGTLEGCQKSYRQIAYSEHGDQGAQQQKGSGVKETDCVTVQAKDDKLPDPHGKQTFSVTVNFPGDQEGYVFLVLHHKADEASHSYTPFLLLPDAGATQNVQFQVNFDKWDFVYVVATAPGCKPASLQLKNVDKPKARGECQFQ